MFFYLSLKLDAHNPFHLSGGKWYSCLSLYQVFSHWEVLWMVWDWKAPPIEKDWLTHPPRRCILRLCIRIKSNKEGLLRPPPCPVGLVWVPQPCSPSLAQLTAMKVDEVRQAMRMTLKRNTHPSTTAGTNSLLLDVSMKMINKQAIIIGQFVTWWLG